MNLNYVKEFLIARKDNITTKDAEQLISEIEAFKGTENTLTNISQVMRVINEYNITFITLVEQYEAMPKDEIEHLPARMEKAREILCILSTLHTYLLLSLNTISESTFNMKNIGKYVAELREKKEHFKSEKMAWMVILKSLTQEANFYTEMRHMDIQDRVGYVD